MADIGDWVTPSWSGHAHFGSTGQIIGFTPSGSAKVDTNGDGVTDYWVTNPDNTLVGNLTHQGMLGDTVSDVVDHGVNAFNMVVPVCLAVLAVGIFIKFTKRIKRG